MDSRSRTAVTSTDPRVQAALQDYLGRIDRGERIEVEAFVAQHADVADKLRSFIAFDEEARRLAGVATPKSDPPHADAVVIEPPRSKAEVSTHSVVGKFVETVKPTPGNQAPKGEAAAESIPRRSVVAPSPKSLPPRSPNDLPEKFGRCQVKQKLGEGAMGAVYLAEDTLLQRKVALKTPTFDDDTDGELLKRFYREARAVSKLKHNNLCGVYDVGEIDGRHYISMEFVPGKKLQEFIKPDKPMTEKQAMAVVRKIALAMQEAHAHGVIHRDLKPDNIMVNEKGEPVVMDFGLVHKTESKNSTKLTQQGTLIGSPAYMSKEQVEGDPDKLTGATDQYSLGVILYQLLTSKLPFEGGLHAVLGAILTKEPPPPSQHRPDLNPHLEVVCLKMMAKEAQDRYPSMKAAADALADVVRGTSTAAGASALIRPTGGSPRESAVGTFADLAPTPGTASDFDFDSPMAPPVSRKSPRRRRPARPPRGVLVGSLAAGLALIFAATLWFRSGDMLIKVEIAEGYEVTFDNTGITITDGIRSTKVKSGEHTLHIKSSKSGDNTDVQEFDTEQFVLKKGDKPVVTVGIENGEVVAKLDGRAIPRRSFSVSTTGQSNTAARKKPESIDLLKEVDLKKHTISGKWIRVGEVLISPKEKNASVVLPVEVVPESYQLTVEAERVSGTNNLSLFLVFEGKEAQVVLDSDAPLGICSGLNVLNSMRVDLNETTWRKPVLPEGKRVTVVATVRQGHIQIECDGQTIMDWKGNASSLSHDRYWTASLPKGKLSLGSWDSTFKISRVSFVPLPGTHAPVFDEWDLAKPLGTSGWMKLDDGVLHGAGRGWLATKQDYSDFEVSLEYQLPSGGHSGVFVRAATSGDPSGSEFLEIQLSDDNDPKNSTTASTMQTGSLWKIAARKESLNSTPNQWHTLLVRAVSSRIQVTHDGKDALEVNLDNVAIPATVKRQSSGRIGLQSPATTAGVRFRKIAIRDLTKPTAQITADNSQEWTELFNGRDLTGWVKADNRLPAAWKAANGYMEVVPGAGPIMTAKTFPLDFQLQVEFWVPKEANKVGQARGNSGIFLLGRHEIQILDVFENPKSPPALTSLGALYNAVASQGVVVRPPETWQTFDITFHAPRIDAVAKRNEPGRLTVFHEGKVIIDNAPVTENFSPGSLNTNYGQPGPVGLQDHGSPVRFRNIRIRELPSNPEQRAATVDPKVMPIVVPRPGGVSDLDRVATGKWIPLVDLTTSLSDPARMKFQNGVLELDRAELKSSGIDARDVIVRADVRETQGENVNLWLRVFGPDQNPKSCIACYNCESNGLVEIGKWENNSWVSIKSVQIDRKIPQDQFVSMAFSAIGNTLTVYIDGTRVLACQTTNDDRGGIRLGAFKGKHLFKNAEYQILDSVPAGNPAAIASAPKLESLTEINTSSVEASAWVSSDGSRIYWEHVGTSDGEYQIWQAQRTNPAEPFSGKRVVGSGRQPTLTPDELQMIFVKSVGTKFKRLYTASRASLSESFGKESELVQFGDKNAFNSPFISADGLSLFTNARPDANILSADYFVSRRPSLDASWSKLERVEIRWDAAAQKAPLTWLAMAPDELSFLATHELDVGRFRITRFLRATTVEPFEKFEYLSLTGIGTVYGRAPRYIPATKELFLTAPAVYANAATLAGWQDEHRPDLWVIRNVEFLGAAKQIDSGSPKVAAIIPTDAVAFQKKRFKIFNEQLTWHDAKQKCQQMGGRLAEVRSKEENDFVMKMAVNQIVVGVWLGATDEVQEKRWLWSDGSEVTFKNWSAVGAQPNGTAANDEDYLLMMVKNSSMTKQSIPAGEWFDQPDSSKEPGIGYICEWDAATVPQTANNAWTTVFNGKDLKGWMPMLTTGKDAEIQTATTLGWIVRKGELVCDTNAPGWLRLDKTYGDCEIEFEFFLPRDTNSGLLVSYSGQGQLTGTNKCEIQLEHDLSQKKPEQNCGAIYGIVPPTRNAFKPNLWNEMSVRLENERILVRLNKQLVVDAKTTDHAALRDLPKAGHFGLFNWKGLAKGCKFRNIRVRELTTVSTK